MVQISGYALPENISQKLSADGLKLSKRRLGVKPDLLDGRECEQLDHRGPAAPMKLISGSA